MGDSFWEDDGPPWKPFPMLWERRRRGARSRGLGYDRDRVPFPGHLRPRPIQEMTHTRRVSLRYKVYGTWGNVERKVTLTQPYLSPQEIQEAIRMFESRPGGRLSTSTSFLPSSTTSNTLDTLYRW